MPGMTVALADRPRSAGRSLREQEADTFRRATTAMRVAQDGSDLARAIAHNRLLWSTVITTLRDPGNALPAELRSSLVLLGMVVERELNAEHPDLSFVIGINEHITAGLISA